MKFYLNKQILSTYKKKRILSILQMLTTTTSADFSIPENNISGRVVDGDIFLTFSTPMDS